MTLYGKFVFSLITEHRFSNTGFINFLISIAIIRTNSEEKSNSFERLMCSDKYVRCLKNMHAVEILSQEFLCLIVPDVFVITRITVNRGLRLAITAFDVTQ